MSAVATGGEWQQPPGFASTMGGATNCGIFPYDWNRPPAHVEMAIRFLHDVPLEAVGAIDPARLYAVQVVERYFGFHAGKLTADGKKIAG